MMTEKGKLESIEKIPIADCTFDQLKLVVADMQQAILALGKRQEELMGVLNHNVAEFNKLISEVDKGFITRDAILKKLRNTQKIIIRETNPIVGEWKKAQAEMLDHVFKASDRGPKLDN